jgi:hypothetical protein
MGNLLLLLPHPAKAKLRPPTAAAKRGTLFFCSLSTDGPSSTMTVSITGATGFVGRRLVQKLLSGTYILQYYCHSSASSSSSNAISFLSLSYSYS